MNPMFDGSDNDLAYVHRRTLDGEAAAHIHRRMDSHEELLLEINEKLTAHIALDREMKPAIDELVVMWRGSKIVGHILSVFAAIAAGFLAIYAAMHGGRS